MARVSQNTKYVKLDDGVSFSLVRTNPKLTTNTKLIYNGKRMYMESYASGALLNRLSYKNVPVKSNSTYNKDIASFLSGSGSRAYDVCQNFSDVAISDSFDNQFETLYWCGAEYIDSSFYSEEIGFVAPLYLREKLPNYFLIFKLDTPSNFNLNVDSNGEILDSTFDFKTDILDKAVLIKTFDLREGSVLGKYIRNYVEQESFEFDKSMYVNFSNAEVTYYGINKVSGVLEKKVESFAYELLNNDNPVLKDDKWFTEGYERNNLIFPYIMNIEYLFDDDTFKHKDGETYDFARYIGVYCNNIEIGEFANLDELHMSKDSDNNESLYTQDNAIYYIEDNKKNLHRYSNNTEGFKIDGKDADYFDKNLISGFENKKTTGYAEPLDIYEGFINRSQYGFEILKPLEPGDWVGIEYNGYVECYFADNKTIDAGVKRDMFIGEYSDYRFSVNENSSVSDIAKALVKSVNSNKQSKFEAKCSNNVVVFYAKREGVEYNNAKMLIEASLFYNRKISLPISNSVEHIYENNAPIEQISDSDTVNLAVEFDKYGNIIAEEQSSFGDYYTDRFCGACNVDINYKTDTYKNVFKIYAEESVFFGIDRYLKTNNGEGRKISSNMIFVDAEGKIDRNYRIVIVDDVPDDKYGNVDYNVSVSSTYQVEIMDLFKPKYGILSWFPVKDFDFDINYSLYGQYGAFVDECDKLSKKITYTLPTNTLPTNTLPTDELPTNTNNDYIKELAKSPFYNDYGDSLDTEYDYYFEQIHPDFCLMSKTTPYILKWGYYDEQKDSCENPYRLNVNKVFGVSNLSANTYLIGCDENEYTHNMPYYMSFGAPDYYKEYQYILSDEEYKNYNDNSIKQYAMTVDGEDETKTFSDCVNYWVNIFKNTNDDMFSHFFSGKKYGKRFDRKYSRLLGGDKFHNPSTLFRGVKFEAVRQYNGVEKKSSEYNDYKFSFVYIPVMINDIVFNSTVYFVKNDTFKFIVGIIFVNTMLGKYEHNIFNGDIDYFNKGFVYAACKDLIRPENREKYMYALSSESYGNTGCEIAVNGKIYGGIWEENYDFSKDETKFYVFVDDNNRSVVISKYKTVSRLKNIIGMLDIEYNDDNSDSDNNILNNANIKNIKAPADILSNYDVEESGKDYFKLTWERYYEEFDATIYGNSKYICCGEISCKIDIPSLYFEKLTVIDVCDIDWDYAQDKKGYKLDVSKIHFKSESLQNILINLGNESSIISIKFYNTDGGNINGNGGVEFINEIYDEKGGNCKITVDINSGEISIESKNNAETLKTMLVVLGEFSEKIENLKMNIIINDQFDSKLDSMAFKNYFSVFNQLSAYNIARLINSDYNVNYYSTVEDNKYKIRVVEPDCIEIKDIYEAVPVKITQNNKSVIGSVEIREKTNVDKIGVTVINRYSGFYNPIFNDILYYDDYTYSTTFDKLQTAVVYNLPYSNTNIDYNYNDAYGSFGVVKNMYYHKTNITKSDSILTSENPVYPAINEYAIDYRDYNIFSSSWDEGYYISQDDLDNSSVCEGIGSMKDGLCMFGSKYLNLPDFIFIDTFENGKLWDDKMITDIRDNTDIEIMYKEINDTSVKYHLFIEKRLKRYLTERLMKVFAKYINKNYSFGNQGTIKDDVDEYVEKNLLKLYKVDRVHMYVKSERMGINDQMIENEYLKYVNKNNDFKNKSGFPVVSGGVMLKESNFSMSKINEFDRLITYNLKTGFKESFGFGVSFRRK